MASATSRTQYYTASSLDGFIADPTHSLDWLFQFSDGPTDDYPEFIAAVGALVMGASTYEWILRHLATGDGSDGWPYSLPTWVFTNRTLPRPDGADIRFVRGDVRPVHEEMLAEAGGRNLWIVGGGDLVGQFHDHGLLDELIVTIASVTLGAGMPLLPRRISDPPLHLTSATKYGSAFVQLRYEVRAAEAAG